MSHSIATTAAARRIRWAGLACRDQGDLDSPVPAFVFVHGLTFDRRMWNPVLDALPDAHRAIAFDLPGHGASASLAERGLAPVADALHDAIAEAGLDAPIIIGHSIGGPLAAIYAATYPASGVVTVEAPIRVEAFADGLERLGPQLRGPGFDDAWQPFRTSMQLELVPRPWRELLADSERPSQELVLAYQADLLERPPADVVRWRDDGLERLRAAGIPYLALLANPVDPAERAFLKRRLPQAQLEVWPVGHHFPHLADPARFARLLTEFAM
jgi:pimeloyl-ACP methyl ester carboxylesterase